MSVSTFLPRCNKNVRRRDPCKCHLAAGRDVRRLVLRLSARRGLKLRAGGVAHVSPSLKSISGGWRCGGGKVEIAGSDYARESVNMNQSEERISRVAEC